MSSTETTIMPSASGVSRVRRASVIAVVSSAVEDLTGRPPRSVREVLEAHSSELTGAAA